MKIHEHVFPVAPVLVVFVTVLQNNKTRSSVPPETDIVRVT